MQKLVCYTIPTSIVILILLPLVFSSQENHKTNHNHTSDKQATYKLSPQLSFEITLHGFLLWASMGFLMPVGILIIRMSNREDCGTRLTTIFYFHATLQILSLVVSTAGAIMSIKNFDNSFNNSHQRMGVALYGVIWLQALTGFLRPPRGSKGRRVWFCMHWVLGSTVSLLVIINIYTGLQAYKKKTSKSVKLWTIIFTTEICLISLFYAFQEKWDYIQKQGVILGDQPIRPSDQQISPTDHHKDHYSTDLCLEMR